MSPKRIRGLFQSPHLHTGAQATRPSGLVRALRRATRRVPESPIIDVVTTPERWANALSYSLSGGPLGALSDNDALTIQCKVHVHHGALGIGVVAADGATFVSHERTVLASDTPTTTQLLVRVPVVARHLVFRNVVPNGGPTRFQLLDLAAFSRPDGKDCPVSWSSSGTTSIPLPELCGALSWAREVWGFPFPERRTELVIGAIEIVDVGALPSVFGNTHPMNLPRLSQAKSLTDWKMEADDAPILESLWRLTAPRRHLEFGTWEGFGAALVAHATDAEIWTINLPEGETAGDGTPLYSSTDAGNFIGRLYREAGFADRVHQVLCDSRDIDVSLFASEPFDTVLIDGGHTPGVVAIDTKNALRLLRSGGMCVWHDFCPDPETLSKNLAPLGVVQAVAENFEEWKASFERIFWIRKSWILVGLGKRQT
jgi:predicted O-methyltransferase YrrM